MVQARAKGPNAEKMNDWHCCAIGFLTKNDGMPNKAGTQKVENRTRDKMICAGVPSTIHQEAEDL